jgi:hypothetical protein
MRVSKLVLAACVVSALVTWGSTLAGSAFADETFTATSAIAVPIAPGNPRGGLGSFDIGFDDPVLRLYLLADRSNAGLDVVNTSALGNTSGNVGGIGVLAAGQFVGLTCVNPGPIPPATTVTFPKGDCSGGSGPNGVITVHQKNGNEAWAGDAPVLSFSCSNQTIGGTLTTVCVANVVTPSSVKVVNLKTGGVTHTILTGTTGPTGQFQGARRADELCWDPRDNLVLVANDEAVDTYISFISTDPNNRPYMVIDQIKLDGSDTTHNAGSVKATNGIEQCQWNPRTGLFYLNIPENNGPGNDSKPGAVMVIDPKTLQMVHLFRVDHTKCAGPQGMAIGPNHQILLGCSNAGPSSIIIDERNGARIANLSGRSGVDESWYNPRDNHYLLAASNHLTAGSATPQLGVVDSTGAETSIGQVDNSAVSAGGSHSVAADPFKGHVFVPVNNAAGAKSLICSTASGGIVPDNQGCIAVFTATGPTDSCSADGANVVAQQFNAPQLARALCPSP